MTDDFTRERLGVIDSHLQLALVENAELEAILERVHEQADAFRRAGTISDGAHRELLRVIADSSGEYLKRRDHECRVETLKHAASLVVHTANAGVQRGESDDVRRGYELALRDVHERLLNLAGAPHA